MRCPCTLGSRAAHTPLQACVLQVSNGAAFWKKQTVEEKKKKKKRFVAARGVVRQLKREVLEQENYFVLFYNEDTGCRQWSEP